MNEIELRKQIINEVIRYLMKFADYSTIDVFRIPLEIQKSLMNGIIPKVEESMDKDEKEQFI